jgi:hypothetical protein
LKKPITKKGLVEWLKVKVPSSSPSTEKKKGRWKGPEAGESLECLRKIREVNVPRAE